MEVGGQLDSIPRGDGVSSLTGLTARVTDGRTPGAPLPTLLRILNGGYHPTRLRLVDSAGRPVRIGEVIAHDGRQYRDTAARTGPSRPLRDLGRPILTSTLAFGAAERYEILLVPPAPGRYTMTIDWVHWVTGRVMGSRSIPITATA